MKRDQKAILQQWLMYLPKAQLKTIILWQNFSIEDSIFHASEKMKVKMAVLFLRIIQEKQRM